MSEQVFTSGMDSLQRSLVNLGMQRRQKIEDEERKARQKKEDERRAELDRAMADYRRRQSDVAVLKEDNAAAAKAQARRDKVIADGTKADLASKKMDLDADKWIEEMNLKRQTAGKEKPAQQKTTYYDPQLKTTSEISGTPEFHQQFTQQFKAKFGYDLTGAPKENKFHPAEYTTITRKVGDGENASEIRQYVPNDKFPEWVARNAATLGGAASAQPQPSAAQAPSPVAPVQAAPAQQMTAAKPLDQSTAAALLKEAGGDKDKARQMAKERGYQF